MAVSSRDFNNGKHLSPWYHLTLVGDPDLFDFADHGMRREDIIRKDAMSVATVWRSCGKKVSVPSLAYPTAGVLEKCVLTSSAVCVFSLARSRSRELACGNLRKVPSRRRTARR